jgi:uncharacterized membrane protein YvbJ
MVLICNNCGHHNPDDAKYCEGCGARFTKIIYEDETDDEVRARKRQEEEVYEDDLIFGILNNMF